MTPPSVSLAERDVVDVDAVAGGQRAHDLACLRGAFERLRFDVQNVVGEPPTVREPLQVTCQHGKPVGRFRHRNAHVEP